MGHPSALPASFSRPVLVLAFLLALASPTLAHLALDDQLKDLDARIAASPRDASLYLRRGELRRARAELLHALRDFENARVLNPASVEPDLHAGSALLEAGLASEAVPVLDRVLRIHPGDAQARTLRGRALELLGRHLEAAAEFTLAIQAHPPAVLPQPGLYFERAAALAATGPMHLDPALSGLDEGIRRLGPAVALELAALDLELRLGRHDAALARLDALAEQGGNQGQWMARRGEILLAAGRRAQARAAFEAALATLADLPQRRRASDPVAELEARVHDMLASLDEGSGALRTAP